MSWSGQQAQRKKEKVKEEKMERWRAKLEQEDDSGVETKP